MKAATTDPSVPTNHPAKSPKAAPPHSNINSEGMGTANACAINATNKRGSPPARKDPTIQKKKVSIEYYLEKDYVMIAERRTVLAGARRARGGRLRRRQLDQWLDVRFAHDHVAPLWIVLPWLGGLAVPQVRLSSSPQRVAVAT